MNAIRQSLYKMAAGWDSDISASVENPNPFTSMLDEILFHADLRFRDYQQFQDDGDFTARFSYWLQNVAPAEEKQLLFTLASCLIFIDCMQTRSLYRDAYRSIICPWLTEHRLTPKEILAEDYEKRVRDLLRQTTIFSITQSFIFTTFLTANNLGGIEKPTVLPESVASIKSLLAAHQDKPERIIVLEDFVGSGGQARRVLNLILKRFPDANVLFVPLIMLQEGYETLINKLTSNQIKVRPVFQISQQLCLKRTMIEGERPQFKTLRSFVTALAQRVLEPLDQFDEEPDNEFGYNGCGALVVPAHNTPNNTLPLIHHRAPNWRPLFRRLHHVYQKPKPK